MERGAALLVFMAVLAVEVWGAGVMSGKRQKLQKIWNKQAGKCWLCGHRMFGIGGPDPMAATQDHIIPKSKGGSLLPKNIRLAHRKCNNARSSISATEFVNYGIRGKSLVAAIDPRKSSHATIIRVLRSQPDAAA